MENRTRAGDRTGTALPRTVVPPAAAGLLLVALALSGCTPDRHDAADTAREFHLAIAAGDLQAACSMLLPRAREDLAGDGTCEAALGTLYIPAAGPVTGTEAYGRSAKVEFTQDTVFLAVSGTGWKVTAAGCTGESGAPYACEVGGN